MSSILETRFWTRIQKRRWIEKMTIGIIEDDCLLSQSLELLLQREGYRTVCMYSQKEAETQLRWTEDLLLVDIGLPDGNGMTLYQKLCRNWEKKIPAIFLTARDEEIDMLNAFELGAEDYVVKPFSMKVLLKRIEVVLKRNKGEATHESVICCRNLILFPQRKRVELKGKELLLTAKEYRLLEYLMQNKGQVLTKENILDYIWGVDGQYVVDNSVSVLVNRLRKKLEAESDRPYIKNVFGLGYRMEES